MSLSAQSKRVLLISPPFTYFPQSRILTRRFNYARPPLGLCYLASFLRQELGQGLDIRLLDGAFLGAGEIIAEAGRFRPNVVGISAVTGNVTAAKSLAATIKSLCPEALMVAGGAHISVRPQDAFPEFDLSIMGEGEKPFAALISEFLENGAVSTPGIPGMVTPGGTEGQAPRRVEHLDSLPFPARDLLDLDRYFHSYPHRVAPGRFTTLFTSRGCRFHCSYCGSHRLFPGRKHYFSLPYVFAELEEVVARHRCSLVFFDDDEFLLDKERLSAICEHLVARRYPLKWICHGRPEGADPEMLRLMKRAGCVEIQVGVESGSERILRAMNRGYDSDAVRRFFRLAHREGIRTWATFIVGYPGETEESAAATLRLALETDPSYATFIMLLPFPGTSVFDDLLREGRITTLEWSRYSWHGDRPIHTIAGLSPERLAHLRARAYRRFYLRPGKLLRLARDVFESHRHWEMSRNFLAWLSLSRG